MIHNPKIKNHCDIIRAVAQQNLIFYEARWMAERPSNVEGYTPEQELLTEL